MVTPFAKYVWVVLIVTISLAVSFSFAQEANLGNLVVRFCNDATAPGGTPSLSTSVKGGEEKDICIYLSNGGLSPVKMKINFVDGTITNDVDQKKACQPESTKERFGKYISIPETDYSLSAGQSIEVHATAKFPVSYAGMAYGCITYQAISDKPTTDGMFNIMTRKANFIDILVKGEIKLGLSIEDQQRDDNLGDSSQLIVYKDPSDGHYLAQLVVKNNGNIAQEIKINGSIDDRFHSSALTEQTKKLLPGDSIDFIFPVNDFIPRYEGVVKTNIEITNKPVFEFESEVITEEMRKSHTQNIGSSIFIAPWKLLAALIAFLLIVFALSHYIRNKPRKSGNVGQPSNAYIPTEPTIPASSEMEG